MFFTKLFLVLAFVMLAGQQLSVDSANDFPRLDNPSPTTQPPAPSPTTQPQASSSNASPPVDPSSTSNDARFIRISVNGRPIYPKESSTDDIPGVETDEVDYMNYILSNGRDYYVSAGTLGIDLQHLKIVAIIAHLKAANEKSINFTASTAKYEKFADSLIAGDIIALIKPGPVSTRDEATFTSAILTQYLLEAVKLIPNVNDEVLPDIETVLTPEEIESDKGYATKLIFDAWPHKQLFDLEDLEADMSCTIFKFKQSPFYTLKSIEAEHIEIWALSGMETVKEWVHTKADDESTEWSSGDQIIAALPVLAATHL